VLAHPEAKQIVEGDKPSGRSNPCGTFQIHYKFVRPIIGIYAYWIVRSVGEFGYTLPIGFAAVIN
jgi:hypothetical protein